MPAATLADFKSWQQQSYPREDLVLGYAIFYKENRDPAQPYGQQCIQGAMVAGKSGLDLAPGEFKRVPDRVCTTVFTALQQRGFVS